MASAKAKKQSISEHSDDDSSSSIGDEYEQSVTLRKAAAYALLQGDESESEADRQSDDSEEAPRANAPAVAKKNAKKKDAKELQKPSDKKDKPPARPQSNAKHDKEVDQLLALIEDQNADRKEADQTAADKKRAKKERQKAAKKAANENKENDQSKIKEKVKDVEKKVEVEVKTDQAKATANDGKKKGAKEEDKKKKKTPADMIKQMLKKRQEEEERIRQQELEEQRRQEELERQRLEKELAEQEKREKKKQKEKERVERLKKEGKYMTLEQKQKLQRQRAMVEALKQQGFVVPDVKAAEDGNNEVVEKKKQRPVYEKRKKKEVVKSKSVDEDENIVNRRNKADSIADDVVDSWDQIDEGRKSFASKDKKESIQKEPSNESSEASSAISSDSNKKQPDKPVEEKENVAIEESLALKEESETSLRSPVICVLGHVDTGKTKILDKIRHTHVQDSEAGGITQQIGATFVPQDALLKITNMVPEVDEKLLNLPGLLIIDTPGHESFSNLRLRGSSLCDLAILVVDIMHGIEKQTVESINLLKKRKTPFFVALNKVDRLYEWKANANKDIRSTLKSQQANATIEFKERIRETVLQFAEQGLNATAFWDNKDMDEYVSLVPTSAHTGDGMGNLMACILQYCQTKLRSRLEFKPELECTVLEVKQISGLGTTIDVILVNGYLHVGDTIVLAGSEGPIVTQIRELLMPHPLRELRVKNPYVHNKVVQGAQGIKVVAKDMDKALAGLPLMVAKSDDDLESMKEEMSQALKQVLQSVKLSEKGVYVQASTLGSLEALLDFLRSQKIPYFGINVGPVHKRDVMKVSTMLEHDQQWAVILAFDVKIERDAQQLADECGVRIFQADIIYHLQDAFLQYREELRLKRKQEVEHLAIFPCKLSILAQHVYKSRDPIVVGVTVVDGILKVGAPICVPSKENLFIGTVTSIEQNHKEIQSVRKGAEVCVKIHNNTGEAPKMYGRHFDHEDFLVSRISRETIDVCKEFYRDELQKGDWQLIMELKKVFEIL